MKMKKVVLNHIQFRPFVENLVAVSKKGAILTDDCQWARARGYAVELYVPWDMDTTDYPLKVPNLPFVEFEDSAEDGWKVYDKEYLESLTIAELQEVVGNKDYRNKKKLIEIYFANLEGEQKDEDKKDETGED
jgi:predicted P-loop ATPase/GTPase